MKEKTMSKKAKGTGVRGPVDMRFSGRAGAGAAEGSDQVGFCFYTGVNALAGGSRTME
jgi:hypothetical protein